MGQLERYGLYVLVVVIFLILGVAIWGGDPASGQEAGPGSVPGAGLSVTESPPGGSAGGDQDQNSAERLADYFVDPDEMFEDVPGDDARKAGGGSSGGPREDGVKRREDSAGPRTPVPLTRTHKIKDGELLEEISFRYYGTRHKWPRIVDANPGLRANALRIGAEITIPPAESGSSPARGRGGDLAAGGGAAGTTHEVQDGESPAKIAKRYYGSEKYAQMLMDQNGIRDATRLRVGTVLRIPPKPPRD